MSGRRSQPAPLPVKTRIVNDRLHVGTRPWFDYDFCGTVRDTAAFDGCPVCIAEIAEQEREHFAVIGRKALARVDTSTTTIH
jgi:hypothetical protein